MHLGWAKVAKFKEGCVRGRGTDSEDCNRGFHHRGDDVVNKTILGDHFFDLLVGEDDWQRQNLDLGMETLVEAFGNLNHIVIMGRVSDCSLEVGNLNPLSFTNTKVFSHCVEGLPPANSEDVVVSHDLGEVVRSCLAQGS